MKSLKSYLIGFLLVLFAVMVHAQGYKNFNVAIYARAYEVEKMSDLNWLESNWDEISKSLHVDKIYLETHRDLLIVSDETLEKAIKFFKDRGVEVGGGITYTINEMNNFETFCYSNPEHRKKAQEIAEHTAKHFDDFILDDFFFTSCKCDLCIEAKGEQSWTEFRLELMKNAANDLIINPSKAVNPDVNVIIKYPNWYDHFQGLGFNLDAGPKQFDGLYTGTETRGRSGNQHLQQYHGYSIFRYFENLKPGKNFGGWVDTGGGTNPLDRYAEQLWLTLFAKSSEITLFDFRQMIGAFPNSGRASWTGGGSNFNFDEMAKPIELEDGSMFTPTKFSRVAGHSFDVVDDVIGAIGNPVGIKSYKPFHSLGEDHLPSFLGMIGIPMDIVPEFPENEEMVLLTEQASVDPDIVEKIKKQLKKGKKVTVTSGFYKAMQGKGIEDIVEMDVTDRKAHVNEYSAGWGGAPGNAEENKRITIPQVLYLTNDSREVISGLDDTNGWPILHLADYSKGQFYVLTVPDNFVDFYNMPATVLNKLRENIAGSLAVRFEGPSEVSLFVYDNSTFIVESFLDEEVKIKIIFGEKTDKIVEVITGDKIETDFKEAMSFRGRKFGVDTYSVEVTLKPHSFKAFSF